MKLFLLSILSFINFYNFSQTTENQPPIIFEGVVLSATEFYIDSTGNPNFNTNLKILPRSNRWKVITIYLRG